ncbi:MAG: Rid family hydrolase [Planctomycetota bacterium]
MDEQGLPQRIETDHHAAMYEAFAYPPGVVASGRFAFISGQVGFEDDGSISDDPEVQINRAFANLGKVLEAVPATPRQVVDLTTLHRGMEVTLPLVSAAKAAFFGDGAGGWEPAWTVIGVAELALPALVFEVRAVVCVS